MDKVRAKKHLGQHFLKDLTIAEETVAAFNTEGLFKNTIEVGPGMGVLTNCRHRSRIHRIPPK